MYSPKNLLCLAALISLVAIQTVDGGHSASEDDALVISAFRQRFMRPCDHARVVRSLVHAVNWAPIVSLSRDKKVEGFSFVNVISIADSAEGESSKGKIFLLTDLDFTGKDWRHDNKVTLLFTSEQIGNCSRIDVDPMEPICPRSIINGKIKEIKKGVADYEFGWNAFIQQRSIGLRDTTFYCAFWKLSTFTLWIGMGVQGSFRKRLLQC